MEFNGTNTARTTGLASWPIGWVQSTGIGLLRAANVLETWSQRARQRRHLGELPAERLADIGVSIEAAAEEASKPFWRK